MASKKISDRDCQKFVYDLIKRPNVDAEHQPYTVARDVQNIMNRIKQGMGQDQSGGTLWGVLNGVTEFCDHEKQARSADKSLWNSWFGPTADLKSKAYDRIMDMV